MGDSSKFLSTGFSKGSDREFKVWDMRNSSSPLFTKLVDIASGVLIPYYDAGTGVVFFTGRGDTSITFFELVDEQPFAFGLNSFPTGLDPIIDIAVLPKNQCDVKKVEIDRMLKITTKQMEPISFSVPRNRLEFFQDDLYPPTPVSGVPTMTSAEWFSGSKKEPKLTSLQPNGMQPLSDAPKIVREKKYKFDPNKPVEKDNQDLEEAVLNRFYTSMSTTHKDQDEAAKKAESEVKDDEWDD
jgi:coronin-7